MAPRKPKEQTADKENNPAVKNKKEPPVDKTVETKPQAGTPPQQKEPIVINLDDSSEEARLFGIMERLFDDMAKNPNFNISQVGGLAITIPDGEDLKLTKDNVEKLTVIHLLFKKLIENEPEAVEKKHRKAFGRKIGSLIKAAGKGPVDARELIKEIFQQLPPEKRQQRPPPPPQAGGMKP